MKFIIGSCGGHLGQSTINILRSEYPDAELVGIDSEIYQPSRLLVDKFFQVPSATKNTYLTELLKIISAENVDFFIPLHESEIETCLDYSEKILESGVGLISVAKHIWDSCSSKMSAFETCLSAGLPFVQTKYLSEIDHTISYPIFVKPNFGSGSRGASVINSDVELNRIRSVSDDLVVQEVLTSNSPEVTVAIFRDGEKDIRVLQLERALQAGASTWVRVILNPEIDHFCRELAEFLDLSGSINVQLFITDKGPVIFEINARFSSSMELRNSLGFHDLIWSLNLANGEVLKPYFAPAIGAQAIMTREAKVFL